MTMIDFFQTQWQYISIGLERKSCLIENNIYLTNKDKMQIRNTSKASFVRVENSHL